MIAAATARARDSFPESSTARRGRLSRRLAAVAGAAGAAAIGGSEAEAVVYTPTAGIAAAQGIPGFSFVDASSVTLGSLRPPATAGVTTWDVDNNGTSDFQVSNDSSSAAWVTCLNGAGINAAGNSTIANIATGGLVGPALTLWQTNFFRVTYQGQNFSQTQFTTNTSGQFGFRFNNAADTYYGWGSLVVDFTGVGQGFRITEAYYNTTPNAAISVGAVPQAVPEPASMALLGLGAAGVAAWRSRKKVPEQR